MARERIAAAIAHAGATGEALVIHHRPAAGIVQAAAEPPASVVVVGTRGRTGFSRLMLGSVAEEVIGHAPCSVLVAPLERET
jgi:nucleotide-binding universal stress UspA family protein